MHANQHTIGIRAIIILNDSIVMVEHRDQNGDFFVFPGGGVEDTETLEAACKREVLEETKLDIEIDHLAYIREICWKGEMGLEFYFVCKYISGQLELGMDPEFSTDAQILKSVKAIKIGDLKNEKWYPEELHNIIEADFKNDFPHIRYFSAENL